MPWGRTGHPGADPRVPASRRSIAPAVRDTFYVCLAATFLAHVSAQTGDVSWYAVALNTLTLLVALALSTAAHEAAHALVAHALGLSVTAVYVGRGPAWRTWVVGRTRVVIQRVPFTGLTMVAASSMRWIRVRLMAVYAAGPLSNLLLLAAVWPMLRRAAFTDFALRPTPVFAFATMNAVLALMTAIPARTRPRAANKKRQGTDGWNFLGMPFCGDETFVPMLVAHAAWRAPQLVAAGNVAEATALVADALKRAPTSPVARVAHGDLLVFTRQWTEAAAALRLLVDDAAVKWASPASMPILANNPAWADFMQDDPALLDEANRWSKQALAQLPDWPPAHGTRGAVLLARGELAEADELLTFAFARNGPRNQALNACCLAMLHAQRGARAEAEAWLEKARSTNPACYLLERTELRLKSQPAQSANIGSPNAAECG